MPATQPRVAPPPRRTEADDPRGFRVCTDLRRGFAGGGVEGWQLVGVFRRKCAINTTAFLFVARTVDTGAAAAADALCVYGPDKN